MICLSKVDYTSAINWQKNTIETGFKDYDAHIWDWKPSEITILFGRNGDGKSSVASQILAHHVNCGKRAYLFSGELGQHKIQDWFYRQVIGADDQYYQFIKGKYGTIKEPKESVIKALKKWHESRLFIYNVNDPYLTTGQKIDLLFRDMENAVIIGVSLIIIDNMMTAIEASATAQNANQSNFTQRCKDFVMKHKDVHICIVAHSKKEDGELTIKDLKGTLKKNDICGTSDIPNKADNIIAIERVWQTDDDDEIDVAANPYGMYMTNLKDRQVGVRKTFKYMFNPKSLRFYNAETPSIVEYDWEKYIERGVVADEMAQRGFVKQL